MTEILKSYIILGNQLGFDYQVSILYIEQTILHSSHGNNSSRSRSRNTLQQIHFQLHKSSEKYTEIFWCPSKMMITSVFVRLSFRLTYTFIVSFKKKHFPFFHACLRNDTGLSYQVDKGTKLHVQTMRLGYDTRSLQIFTR